MADKYYNIADMASSAAERITQNADAWTDYLETAARLYRYGFKDQLLIHAQRPDATAVASIEVWNTRMHCWVNQGAKGIALLDETRKKKLRYVFDVSDVHKAKRIGIFPTLWEMKDQHHEAVMKRLEDIYGKTDEKRPIESRMIQIAEHIAEDYTPDVLQDLVNVQDDSLLYGLDEYNLSLRLKETMTSSIAYTLMARCGLDTDTYRDELDFSYIREFSTLDSLSVLGEATSSMCEPVLREICQVVEDIDRENARRVERESSEKDKNILANDGQEHYNTLKRESDTQNRKEGGTDYGTDIQERRGLSHSEHQSERGAGGEPDEVRNASGDISEGTSRGDLHREASVGNADGTLSDDTETGRGEVRETEKPDDGERGSDGGVKEQRSDGVGSSDELDNEQSGRDRSVGDRLQSVVEVEYKQLSIFPYLDEQMGTIAAAEAGMKSITHVFETLMDYGSISLDESGKPLVDSHGNTIYNNDVERGRRLDIVIGLPASGKSSAIVDTISYEHHSMLIDNDEAKRQFPEFNKGWGANTVHKESQIVEQAVFREALREGRNIVLPKVGSDADKLMTDYIAYAKDAGYKVNVHFVDLDRNKALGRMMGRFIHTGRYLSPELIDKYANERDGNKIAQAYEALKSMDGIDGCSKWDNDVGRGEKPILLEAANLDDDFIKNARMKGDMENEERKHGQFTRGSEDDLCFSGDSAGDRGADAQSGSGDKRADGRDGEHDTGRAVSVPEEDLRQVFGVSHPELFDENIPEVYEGEMPELFARQILAMTTGHDTDGNIIADAGEHKADVR